MSNSNNSSYYNLAGKFTKSEKEFKKYLKKEIAFYQKQSEEAKEKGWHGTTVKRKLFHAQKTQQGIEELFY